MRLSAILWVGRGGSIMSANATAKGWAINAKKEDGAQEFGARQAGGDEGNA